MLTGICKLGAVLLFLAGAVITGSETACAQPQTQQFEQPGPHHPRKAQKQAERERKAKQQAERLRKAKHQAERARKAKQQAKRKRAARQ